MKKTLCFLIALLMIFMCVGCNSNSENTNVIDSGQNKTDSISSEKIDVDLTKLSSTVVYSEVYNMMTAPSDYIGKKVKMNGQFALYQATDVNGQVISDQVYYACVIADATACCQQGLEFILSGDRKYPDDYPEIGSDITVVGEFQTYMEGTQQYCHLINSEFSN